MKERLNYFDILRAIAIVGVLFIHVNNVAYQGEQFSLNYNLSIALRQVANFAVPLFLFISGYFMSKKVILTKEDYFNYIKKQVPRVLLPFIVWSTVYSIAAFALGSPISLIIKEFFTFQAAPPFYFILLIIQYYLIQPLIVRLGSSKKGVLLALFISLASCFIIELLRYRFDVTLPIYIYAGNFLTWLVFPVLGAYVNKYGVAISANILLLITFTFLLLSVLHTVYLIVYFDQPVDAVTAVKATSFLYSAAISLYLFKIKEKLTANNHIVTIGLLSFGIYFSHMIFVTIILKISTKLLGVAVVSNVLTQLAVAFIVLLISYIIGLVALKINRNLTNKFLGY